MCDGAFVSDLVNYNTRGVQLPPGCKDLIDVLNLSVQDMPGFPKWPSGAQPEEIETGTLQDMENSLTWLITDSIKPSFLAIRIGGFPLELRCETVSGPLVLYLLVPANEMPQAELIQAFFNRRGQDVLDSAVLEQWHVFRYRVPCVARSASDLMCNLLKEAYQVSMITPLQFVYGRQPGGQW